MSVDSEGQEEVSVCLVSSNTDFHGLVLVAFLTASFAFNPVLCYLYCIVKNRYFQILDVDLNP